MCRYFCRPANWVDLRVEPKCWQSEILQDLHVHVHVHVSTIMQYLCIVYMHMYVLCGYTRHLRTCRYVAIHVNSPVASLKLLLAIAVNRTLGVKKSCNFPGMFTNTFMIACILRIKNRCISTHSEIFAPVFYGFFVVFFPCDKLFIILSRFHVHHYKHLANIGKYIK